MDLWAIQDAFKAALEAQVPQGIPVDLGHPATLQPRHLWVAGNGRGRPDYDLTNDVESGHEYTLTIHSFVQYAGTYEACRAELAALWDHVSAALGSIEGVDQVRAGDWRVDEGVSPEGHRQLGFSRDVICTTWL